MSRGAYLIGSIELIALVAALGFAAYRIRRVLVPDWSRSPARLAEAILGVTLFTVLVELLGTFGLLQEAPLLIGGALAAAGAEVASRRRPLLGGEAARPDAGPVNGLPSGPASATALAVIGAGLGALVLARWLIPAGAFLDQGMWAYDTMWYHMPLAARFAQSGSLTSLHYLDPLNIVWFYPMNSELLHTAGILLFSRDILSPLLNLGWLGLALLAAWCAGRPYGVAPRTLAAAAIVLVTPALLLRQPGNAHSDIPAIALLLASAAILLNAFPGGKGAERPSAARLGPLIPAALAAGLAAGSKLSLLVPVLALSAAVIAISSRESRLRVSAAWLVPAFATGAFWYLRNLFTAGNPLPFRSLGVGPIELPAPERVVEFRPDFAVAHYLTDSRVWDDWFLPGLDIALGDLWFVILALSFAGIISGLALHAAPAQKALAACGLIGSIGYVLTPLSAAGPDGFPVFFAGNLRWLTPLLALGLVLLPTLPWARLNPAVGVAAAVTVGLTLVVTLGLGFSSHDPYLRGAVIIGASAGALAVLFHLLAGRLPRGELIASACLVVTLAIAAYWREASHYLESRYTNVWPGLSVSRSFNWAREVSDARIAIAGTTAAFFQYGYYGNDASNAVQYIGRPGPHGAFAPIESCQEWRTAVSDGDFDYLVASPTLNPRDPGTLGFAPERSWIEGDPAAEEILIDGPLSVYRIAGPLDPAGCGARGTPFAGLPPLFERP